MSTQDILNIILIIGIVVVIICVVFTSYFLIRALKSITSLAESLEQTAYNIKEKIQMRALAAIPAVLISLVSKIFRRRG